MLNIATDRAVEYLWFLFSAGMQRLLCVPAVPPIFQAFAVAFCLP